MGLSNSAKRSSTYSQIINRNQGGGNKKAGFPYQVGRDWHASIAIQRQTLPFYQRMLFTRPVIQSRGVGVDVRIPMH